MEKALSGAKDPALKRIDEQRQFNEDSAMSSLAAPGSLAEQVAEPPRSSDLVENVDILTLCTFWLVLYWMFRKRIFVRI